MSSFADGVTITVNGSPVEISAAEQQADHAVVHYTIPAVQEGDTVTWEYDADAGHIRAESDGAALGDVSPQALMNNVAPAVVLPQVASATLLFGQLAKNLVLSDSDPVSTFNDQYSGSNHDFTQTGSVRPVYRAGSGSPYAEFNGSWMLGDNFLDDFDKVSFFMVLDGLGNSNTILSKISTDVAPASPGWIIDDDGTELYWLQDNHNQTGVYTDPSPIAGKRIYCAEKLSHTEGAIYINGVSDFVPFTEGTFTSFSNSEPVRLGVTGQGTDYAGMNLYAILIYQIDDLVNWPTDRAAITTWLATECGITL
jgi:hypothetical protein